MPNAEQVASAKLKLADALMAYDKACNGIRPVDHSIHTMANRVDTWNGVVYAVKQVKAAEDPAEWYIIRVLKSPSGPRDRTYNVEFRAVLAYLPMPPFGECICGPYTKGKAESIALAFNS